MKILKKSFSIVASLAILVSAIVTIALPTQNASALSGCVAQNYYYGKTGVCVTNIQTMLNGFADAANIQRNYSYNYSPGCAPAYPGYISKISEDNVFGSITKRSVQTYQKATCLSADGVVGPKTWSNLCYTIAAARNGNTVTSAIYSAYNAARNSGCGQLQPWGY